MSTGPQIVSCEVKIVEPHICCEGETYLHRIGRTGRFGKHGLAINLVDGPKSMAVLKEIERHFGKDILKLDSEVGSFKSVQSLLTVKCSRTWTRLRS